VTLFECEQPQVLSCSAVLLLDVSVPLAAASVAGSGRDNAIAELAVGFPSLSWELAPCLSCLHK